MGGCCGAGGSEGREKSKSWVEVFACLGLVAWRLTLAGHLLVRHDFMMFD
jgi:hypothetical protein